MSPTTGWLIIGGWLLLSIIVGLFLGAFIKAGRGEPWDEEKHNAWRRAGRGR